MLAIDLHAWTNRWSRHHPLEKLLLTGGMMVLCLALPALTIAPLAIAVMTLATVAGAGVPLAAMLRVLAVPGGFLLTGAPLLAVSIDFAPQPHLDVTAASLWAAAAVTLRSLGAVSCLGFLVLTTPLADLLGVLGRLGVPRPVLELMMLMSRLIFVFLERGVAGHQALAARLGYGGWRASVRSLGMLAANLFQRSLDRGRRLEMGLAARVFDGSLPVPASATRPSVLRLAGIATVLAVVGMVGWALDGVMFWHR